MNFIRFRDCIGVLQQKTVDDIQLNKQVLTTQKDGLIIEQNRVSLNLKQTTVNSDKVNLQLKDRIEQIRQGELLDYRNNLKMQQSQGFASKISLLTIARITEKNQEIERLERAMQENSLKVETKAKFLARTIQDVNKVNDDLSLMGDCLLVSDFLTMHQLAAADIADYELDSLYQSFPVEG